MQTIMNLNELSAAIIVLGIAVIMLAVASLWREHSEVEKRDAVEEPKPLSTYTYWDFNPIIPGEWPEQDTADKENAFDELLASPKSLAYLRQISDEAWAEHEAEALRRRGTR